MMAQVEYSRNYELRGKDREENAEHNLRLYTPRRAGPHAHNKRPAGRPAGSLEAQFRAPSSLAIMWVFIERPTSHPSACIASPSRAVE
jgi:hypothetical protein